MQPALRIEGGVVDQSLTGFLADLLRRRAEIIKEITSDETLDEIVVVLTGLDHWRRGAGGILAGQQGRRASQLQGRTT